MVLSSRAKKSGIAGGIYTASYLNYFRESEFSDWQTPDVVYVSLKDTR